VEDKVPETYNKLWGVAKNKEVFSLWKDAEYFKWRYDSNPDNKFKYFYVAEKDVVKALFVVNLSQNKAKICEVITKDENTHVTQLLLNHLKMWLIQNKFEYLEFIGKNKDIYTALFKNFRNVQNKKLIFCIREFKNSTLGESLFVTDNWNITMGDMDNV
jgi:hypothetical protein